MPLNFSSAELLYQSMTVYLYLIVIVIVFNCNEIGQPINNELIQPIERVHSEGKEKSFKLLGVHLDEYLSFNAHITHLCISIA